MTDLTTQTEAFGFPSVIQGLDFSTYLEIEALNSHGAQTILDKSPAHFAYEREHPREQSAAMRLGTLLHDLLLEPEKCAYRIIPEGADKASNMGKEVLVSFYCAALEREAPRIEEKLADGKRLSAQLDILEASFAERGLYAVKQEAFGRAQRMRDSLFANPIAKSILDDGSPEVTLLWRDREFQVPKKARVDWLPEAHEIMPDIKTIAAAGWEDTMRSVAKFGYRLQAAHYLEGAAAVGLPHKIFALFFVESDPPHGVRLVHFDPRDVQEGAARLRAATRQYAEAVASGRWPGYPVEIERIDLPKWAK